MVLVPLVIANVLSPLFQPIHVNKEPEEGEREGEVGEVGEERRRRGREGKMEGGNNYAIPQ